MSTTVANWFRRKLGMAMGIMACGFAFGGLAVPMVVALIDSFGWRTALLILGLVAWGIGFPLAMVFRHRPEQYGYQPDGEQSIVTDPDQVPATEEIVIGTKEALRSRTFWHLGVAGMFQSVAIGTSLTHVMPFLGSIGIERSTASLVAMSIPLVSIAGRLSAGWLSDRFIKTRVAAGFFLLTVLGLVCVTLASTGIKWLIVPYIIFFGIGWACNSTVRVTMLREFFGRSRFGTIFGISMGMSALGMIIGPLFAGWVYDTWGSYQIAWTALTFLVLAGMIIIATTPPLNIKTRKRPW
jgi:sugar phosphate permease